MNWDNGFKILLMLLSVIAAVAGSGRWLFGLVTAISMGLVWLFAAMVQHRHSTNNET